MLVVIFFFAEWLLVLVNAQWIVSLFCTETEKKETQRKKVAFGNFIHKLGKT